MNNCLLTGYHTLLALVVGGFAIYDIFKRRVPNRALAFFLPLAAVSPFLVSYLESYEGATASPFLINLGVCAIGALAGGAVLLAASLATKGGLGGGDIKLAAVLGFAYGPLGILNILLIATPLALVAALIQKHRKKSSALSLPFVPFLFVGCVVLTLAKILF